MATSSCETINERIEIKRNILVCAMRMTCRMFSQLHIIDEILTDEEMEDIGIYNDVQSLFTSLDNLKEKLDQRFLGNSQRMEESDSSATSTNEQ